MREEVDFIKLIDGYSFYRYDYADFLYKNLKERDDKLSKLKEYIITHKIYDEVKFKSELLKIIGGIE